MRRFSDSISFLLVAGLLLASVFIPLFGAYAGSRTNTPLVVVKPSAGSYEVGETIAVEVWVEDVVDLYGADLYLTFDAGRLQALDADPGLPGVQVQPRADLLAPDFVLKREADNEAGAIWYVVTQVNPTPPASGSGALFSFTFETLAPGEAAVAVAAYQLADVNGMTIPAQALGAGYQVEGGFTSTPTATSTPTTTSTSTATSTPTAMSTPNATSLPTATSTPTATKTPDATTAPTVTSTPTATGMPIATNTPTATTTPTPTLQPVDDARLRVLPASGYHPVGGALLVEVWVEDVVDLYTADVRLAFDNERLQVQDADPDVPGVQVIPRADLLAPDLILRRDADNAAGAIRYAVTQLSPREPVGGSGALFAFHLELVGTGAAGIRVVEVTLATRSGAVIPAAGFGAVYTLTGDTDRRSLFLPLVRRNP